MKNTSRCAVSRQAVSRQAVSGWTVAILAGALCSALATLPCVAQQDQDSFTPMPLDAGFGRMDLTPPPIPPDQIIQKFAAKETEFQEALDHYTYRRMAKVEEIDDDNKVSGEWYQVTDVIFDPSGRRTEHVVYAPESTLKELIMTPSDMSDIQQGYPFVLTTSEVGEYNIKYVGKQRVDEVDCYVFDVSPKEIKKGKRYLDGRIWVDSEELQIVVTDGRMVPDDTRKNHQDLHPPFMTWRQQIDGHYWFPVYTRAEGILHFAGGNGYMSQDVHVRDIIKYTDYKRFGSTMRIVSNGGEVPQGQTPPSPQQQKPKQ